MTQIQKVNVLAARLPAAVEALQALTEKAKRLGVEGVGFEVVRNWTQKTKRTHWSGQGHTVEVEWTEIAVSTAALKVGNYELLARMEITGHGNLIDALPGADIEAQWHEWGGACEHCNTNRRRKHLFVVKELGTGRQMAVGRTCLRLFLGTDSAKSIAAHFGFWESLRQAEHDPDGFEGFRSFRYVQSLYDILSMTAVVVRKFGWASVTTAKEKDVGATSEYVSFALDKPPMNESVSLYDELRGAFRNEDGQTASDIIEWVRSEFQGTSTYAHNLKTIFKGDEIYDRKRIALVVSAYGVWDKARQSKASTGLQRPSEWMGQPKERLRNIPAVYQGANTIGSHQYGETVLVSFITEGGNILKWFTSQALGDEYKPGESVTLTATVKDHSEYKGQRETIISRCSISPA